MAAFSVHRQGKRWRATWGPHIPGDVARLEWPGDFGFTPGSNEVVSVDSIFAKMSTGDSPGNRKPLVELMAGGSDLAAQLVSNITTPSGSEKHYQFSSDNAAFDVAVAGGAVNRIMLPRMWMLQGDELNISISGALTNDVYSALVVSGSFS